jgi:hypothetical protein
MKIPIYVPLLATILIVVVAFGDRLPSFDWTTSKVDAVTYVYEKSDHALPSYVTVALNKLNREGIVASYYEADTTDDEGQVPDQFKAPLEAAKESGMPALVATSEGEVVKTIKDPKTELEILEAVK